MGKNKATAEKLKPDRDKISDFLDKLELRLIYMPVTSTDQMTRQMEYIQEELTNFIKKWRERI